MSIEMNGTFEIDYTQGKAKVLAKGDKFTAWCETCKSLGDMGDIQSAYSYAVNHHNARHRL